MKRLCVLIRDDRPDIVALTPLLKRFVSESYSVDLICDKRSYKLFKNLNKVRITRVPNATYDEVINFSPSFSSCKMMEKIKSDRKLGYVIKDELLSHAGAGAKIDYESKFRTTPLQVNQFQVLFGIALRSWKGEGYELNFYPRSRCKHSLTGFAIKSSVAKDLIWSKLKLEQSRAWRIPFREDYPKQLDEINRCGRIVTDDQRVLHLSLALRKKVVFLSQGPLPCRIEFFGQGNVIPLDDYA